MLSAFPISSCACKRSACLQLFGWPLQLFHTCFSAIHGNCSSCHPSVFPTPSYAPWACHTTCLSPFLLIYSLSHIPWHIWAPLQLLTPPNFLSPSILHIILSPEKVSLYPFPYTCLWHLDFSPSPYFQSSGWAPEWTPFSFWLQKIPWTVLETKI